MNKQRVSLDRTSSEVRRIGATPHPYIFAFAFLFMIGVAPSMERYYLWATGHANRLQSANQLLLGKIPGVDYDSAIGPVQLLFSLPTFLFEDSLLIESILCSFAYAWALYLIFALVRDSLVPKFRWPSIPALVALLLGMWQLARFYKWYYWLFPLLAAHLLLRYVESSEDLPGRTRQLRLVLLGVVAGAATLTRIELGIAVTTAIVLLFGVQAIDARNWIDGLRSVVVALLPPILMAGLWLSAVLVFGGSPWEVLLSFVNGTHQVTSAVVKPFPTFAFAESGSESSGLAIMFAVTLLTYLGTVLFGTWTAFSSAVRLEADEFRLLTFATFGLGIYPQAYAMDVSHFQQVLPPFLAMIVIGPFVLLGRLRSAARYVAALAAAVFSVITCYGLFVIANFETNRYEPFAQDIVGRYQAIHYGPEYFVAVNEGRRDKFDRRPIALAKCMVAAELLCPEGESVLLLGSMPGSFYVKRPIAGLFTQYYPNIYEDSETIARDLAAIRSNPPALVVKMKRRVRGMMPLDRYDEYLQEEYTVLSTTELDGLPMTFLVSRTQRQR